MINMLVFILLRSLFQYKNIHRDKQRDLVIEYRLTETQQECRRPYTCMLTCSHMVR